MGLYPPTLVRLIKEFSRLPGIGEKTAERLAMHVLKAPSKRAQALSESLLSAKRDIRMCGRCFGLSDAQTCHICENPARDARILCVVEQPSDLIALEKSGAFIGLYHVLQGTLSPMDGIGPDNLRIRELMDRVQNGGVREVILATGTSLEGDATASYISDLLKEFSVSVTRIASGVPIGGDLKYIDGLTLKRALDTRLSMKKEDSGAS